MQRLDTDGWNGVSATIDAPVEAKLLVNGKPPNSIAFHAKVRRVTTKHLEAAHLGWPHSVFSY